MTLEDGLPGYPARDLLRMCEPNHLLAKPIILALGYVHQAINVNTLELRSISTSPETLRLLLEPREKGKQ